LTLLHLERAFALAFLKLYGPEWIAGFENEKRKLFLMVLDVNVFGRK